jgi:hypothetical protein
MCTTRLKKKLRTQLVVYVKSYASNVLVVEKQIVRTSYSSNNCAYKLYG